MSISPSCCPGNFVTVRQMPGNTKWHQQEIRDQPLMNSVATSREIPNWHQHLFQQRASLKGPKRSSHRGNKLKTKLTCERSILQDSVAWSFLLFSMILMFPETKKLWTKSSMFLSLQSPSPPLLKACRANATGNGTNWQSRISPIKLATIYFSFK